ncbi:MAG: WYL domain-containing protein [Bacteroidia bacterium]|nr:WYL domain-containing protein [Bacteroidia bacterium]
MNIAIKQALQSAVSHKAVCQVKLKKEPGSRHLHPYGLLKNPGGKHMLICWQDSGHSKSGKMPNFRTLPVDEVAALEITDQNFDFSEKFNPSHKMYKGWEFHL